MSEIEQRCADASPSSELESELGDVRRTSRLQWLVGVLSEAPNESLPQLFEEDADLEAVYRFFGNQHFSYSDVLSHHVQSTARRAQHAGEVLVLHDSTEFGFSIVGNHLRANVARLSASRQGFHGHLSLVTTADESFCP